MDTMTKKIVQISHEIETDNEYCGANCPQREIDITMGSSMDGCKLYKIRYLKDAGGLKRYRCEECLKTDE